MSHGWPLIDRFVVGVDVQDYSSRDARRQRIIQGDLEQILREAADAAGLDREQWMRFPGGDGEMAVLPADVDMAAVVGPLVQELNSGLTRRNEDLASELQIRLRVAMHVDAVVESAQGYAGQALVVLRRLLDSSPVRLALDQAGQAELALIISERVYGMVVQSGLLGLRPRHFVAVEVDIPAKRFNQVAYLHVPNHDMGTFAPFPADPAPPVEEPTTKRSTTGSDDGTDDRSDDRGPRINAGRDMRVGGDLFIGRKTLKPENR